MNYHHNFGKFYESITIDGALATYELFEALTKEGRVKFRKQAMDRCIRANETCSKNRKMLVQTVLDNYDPLISMLTRRLRAGKTVEGVKFTKVQRDTFKSAISDMKAAKERQLLKVEEHPLLQIEGCTYPAAVDDVFRVWEEKIAALEPKEEQ